MLYEIIGSPLGAITLVSDGTTLTELHIAGDKYFAGIRDSWTHAPGDAVFAPTRTALTAYFNGGSGDFAVPVAFAGTPFQQQVWRELQQIPAGQTVTYTELAARIGRPQAVRAVGTAVGRNPICIVVPCHRVVGSSGSLTGYVAGIARKQFLLQLEGAR